jgi:hypothetical protein
MAIQLTKLNIFVSGTSETDAEKAALKAVAEELCILLEKTRNITLGVLGWPDNIRPGVNDDPQKEINRQLSGQYDIYIGLLGTRFGTPTPRAGSGTEEEFDIAIAQFVHDTTSVRVLFYFKKEIVDPFSMDLSQLEKVKKFRARLPQIGVLYRDFKDTANFVDIIRENLLNLIVDEWKPPSWIPIELSSKSLSLVTLEARIDKPNAPTATSELAAIESRAIEDLEEEQNEMGLFELLQEFHVAIALLTTTMENLAGITTTMGGKFELHTKAISQQVELQTTVANMGGSREMQKYISEAKRLVDDAANDLDNYAKEMQPALTNFKKYIGTVFTTLETAYEIATSELELNDSKKKEDIEGLKILLNTMEVVQGQVSSFQQTIESLPALTSKFKKARRNTSKVLGELVAEIRLAFIRGSTLVATIDQGQNQELTNSKNGLYLDLDKNDEP